MCYTLPVLKDMLLRYFADGTQGGSTMSLEGSQIGRFRLLRLLGRGGMGEVYLAEDDQLRRQVAIKVIQAEYPDPDATRLFLREARAIAILNHPHILPLFDFGEATIHGLTLTYMVMPFCKDDTLAAWMLQRRNAAPPSLQDVGLMVQQAASALQYAHNHQIVHQDVKPSNFLIRGSEEASGHPDLLLADFGVAKFTSTTASVSQSVRGTPAYMAPEQWEGTPVPATDQYALAIMAYDLLAGHPPFQGGLGQVMYQHMHVTPQPPSALNPRVPGDVDTVIQHALAKKPEERFASISAFNRAFEQALLADGSSSTVASTPQEPDRSDIHAALAISEEEALMGTHRILPLLGGRQVPVSVPAGTKDGQIIRLESQVEPASDRGSPGALILTITIAPPEEQARQAEAEQLRRAKEEHSRHDEERSVLEAEPDRDSPQLSLSSLGTTEAATVLSGRLIQRYLFALLVGAFAGIFSVFLTGVIYSVLNTVNFQFDQRVGFALLPPLVMSLIAGFFTGKYVVVRTAGLFAGLVVGVSWFVYILYMLLAHHAPPTPYFQPEWVTVVACAATCGPLSWLVAWLTTRTHPHYLSSGSRN